MAREDLKRDKESGVHWFCRPHHFSFSPNEKETAWKKSLDLSTFISLISVQQLHAPDTLVGMVRFEW